MSKKEERAQRWLARAGYAAKAVIYVTIGLLAARAAFGQGGAPTDSRGAMQFILHQPFGRVLLAALTVGALAYVAWRLLEVFWQLHRFGRDATDLARRLHALVSAIVYSGVALAAFKTLLGSSSSGHDTAARDWTAELMSKPFGKWLVVAK